MTTRCWAHARRKFDEALNALPPKQREGTAAITGLEYCNNAAICWFTLAAEQGNEYAQHYLKHLRDQPSLLSGAARLLHHMGNIFQEQRPYLAAGMRVAVDSKLRRKIREKKIAMGHRPDDHEEQVQRQM